MDWNNQPKTNRQPAPTDGVVTSSLWHTESHWISLWLARELDVARLIAAEEDEKENWVKTYLMSWSVSHDAVASVRVSEKHVVVGWVVEFHTAGSVKAEGKSMK